MTEAERVSVRRITTGVVRPKRASRGALRYLIDDWESDALPVNAYLVEHAGGRLLFDTGQTAAAARPGYLPRWHPFLRLARFELAAFEEAGAQLAATGVAPDSIDRIVLSHLHTDHVGGLGAFERAVVIVCDAEWRRAQGLSGRLRGYLPGRWPRGALVRTVTVDGPPVGPFTGSYDVLGDGLVVIVPTPGHTPGHVSLIVRGKTQTWFLAGDLVHAAGDLTGRYPAIARWCKEEGVEILTTHDRPASGGAT